jgi:hypothetical protein
MGSVASAGGSAPETTSITEAAPTGERGMLDLLALGALDQDLGSLQFVVTSASGAVLANGYNEVHGPDLDRHLLLQLPAGVGYELRLSSTSQAQPPTTCTGGIGSFTVQPNATASYEAFVWQCTGAPAQQAPAEACYWLADWAGVTRVRAPVGQTIELTAGGRDTAGSPAHFTWVNQGPQYGALSDKHAATTSFHCQAAGDDIPLMLLVQGDGCSRQISLRVSCGG